MRDLHGGLTLDYWSNEAAALLAEADGTGSARRLVLPTRNVGVIVEAHPVGPPDKTDPAAYLDTAMRERLASLATLRRVADGEAHDLAAEDVASVMGLCNARFVRAADADELAEEARKQIEEFPLCVETVTVYEIVLGTGGPDDRFLVYVEGDDRSRDITRIEYRYSWSGSAERSLSGADYEVAERFAREVVPDLIDC